MKLCRLNNPAICLTYEIWTLIIASITIIFNSLFIITFVLIVILMQKSGKVLQKEEKESMGNVPISQISTFIVCVLGVSILCVPILFSIFLIVGVKKRKKNLLLAWMIYDIIYIIFDTVFLFYFIYNNIQQQKDFNTTISVFIFKIISYIISVVSLTVVNTVRENMIGDDSETDYEKGRRS